MTKVRNYQINLSVNFWVSIICAILFHYWTISTKVWWVCEHCFVRVECVDKSFSERSSATVLVRLKSMQKRTFWFPSHRRMLTHQNTLQACSYHKSASYNMLSTSKAQYCLFYHICICKFWMNRNLIIWFSTHYQDKTDLFELDEWMHVINLIQGLRYTIVNKVIENCSNVVTGKK